MNWLTEPLSYEFFRHGMAVAVLAGALCGLVGTFVVLRGMSYLGHGLSHTVFGAAALGSVLGVPFYAAAGVGGLVASVTIGRLTRRGVLRADAVIGVVTTAAFALGVAVLARWGQARRSLDAVLFGSVLGVEAADVAVVALILATAVLVVGFGYRALLFTTFDPEVARAAGSPVDRLDDLVMVLLALTVMGALEVTGAVLVSACLVIPAATARLVTDRFGPMLITSTAWGAAAGGAGMMAAYHLDIPPGAAITLIATLGFVLAATAGPVRAHRRS
ncbi:MAG: metal ABC transporter permease [Acidimicrobiales bacterium]|nr:metal ABC transporter permease [Acidimicrobiales bacterium]